MCVQKGCEAQYAESALACVLPDALFREYRAQDAVVEQRLFEQNSCDDSIPTQCSALVAAQGL